MFKRRDRRPLWRIVFEAMWPRGGWGRAAVYIKHRVNRLPDPPDRIARGIFAGVFTTFTPFYGLHFFVAAGIAMMMRGNVIAALLATFVGNPLTYVPIGVISLTTGYWLLGLEDDPEHGGLGEKFVMAGRDLWGNFEAMFNDTEANWSALSIFYHEVFFPYMIGGIIPGLIAATVAYYVSLPLITAYQNRRKGLIQERLAMIKKKRAEGGGGAE